MTWVRQDEVEASERRDRRLLQSSRQDDEVALACLLACLLACSCSSAGWLATRRVLSLSLRLSLKAPR